MTRVLNEGQLQRRRTLNREWHHFPRDGRCEAVTKRGVRCRFDGYYNVLSAKVLCGIHDKDVR